MTEQDIDLRAIAGILRRHLSVVVTTFMVTFALATAFVVAVPSKYTATALILVDPEPKNLLAPTPAFQTTSNSGSARIDSEVEILRSSATALAVIATEDLISDPEFGPTISWAEKLRRAIGVANAATIAPHLLTAKTIARFKTAVAIRRKGLTHLISVSVSSQSPQRAADLANAMSRVYIQQQVNAKTSVSINARNVLNGQVDAAAQSLADREKAVDEFVVQIIPQLGAAQDNPDIAKLDLTLSRNAEKIAKIVSKRNTVDAFLGDQDWVGLARSLDDAALENIASQRAVLVKSLSGDSGPVVLDSDLGRQLASLEAALEQQISQTQSGMTQTLVALEQQSAALRRDIRQSILKTDLAPDVLASIYAKRQNANIARAQYETVLARLQDVETQSRIQIADSRLVSPALAPVAASFPNKNLVFLAAFAVASSLGLTLAFVKEFYVGGVTSPTQLSELLQLPTAAVIPRQSHQNEDRLSMAELVIDAPLSIYSESLRKLRASVDQSFRKPNSVLPKVSSGKVILVTSALPAEGKTTTALSLARTYALAGSKTLLIDADLRIPSVHRHVGLDPQAGILAYLRNPSDPDLSRKFYAKDPASPLAMILGSSRSDTPTDQLLNSATFENLLSQAKEVFDIIIVDSPPVLPVVDARYIAGYVDAVTLVVKWAATSQGDLRTARQTLREATRPETGIFPVLTQTVMSAGDSGSDTYYSSYSAAI